MYTVLLPLHLISLAYVAWNVFHADHLGFQWIKGIKPTLETNLVKKYHHGTFLGLGLMLVTGFLLFWPDHNYFLPLLAFRIKMLFVLALIINSFVIGKLSKVPTTNTFASLSTREKIPLIISGAVSMLSWLGAFTMAFFLEN